MSGWLTYVYLCSVTDQSIEGKLQQTKCSLLNITIMSIFLVRVKNHWLKALFHCLYCIPQDINPFCNYSLLISETLPDTPFHMFMILWMKKCSLTAVQIFFPLISIYALLSYNVQLKIYVAILCDIICIT